MLSRAAPRSASVIWSMRQWQSSIEWLILVASFQPGIQSCMISTSVGTSRSPRLCTKHYTRQRLFLTAFAPISQLPTRSPIRPLIWRRPRPATRVVSQPERQHETQPCPPLKRGPYLRQPLKRPQKRRKTALWSGEKAPIPPVITHPQSEKAARRWMIKAYRIIKCWTGPHIRVRQTRLGRRGCHLISRPRLRNRSRAQR